MEKIQLSENHIRAISSSLVVVEKSLNDLEHNLMPESDQVMYRIIRNEGINLHHYYVAINQIRSYIRKLYFKYNLDPTSVSFNGIVMAKKSSMWEVLCETTSKRLKGYGKFPAEYADEFDEDIDKLQALINNI